WLDLKPSADFKSCWSVKGQCSRENRYYTPSITLPQVHHLDQASGKHLDKDTTTTGHDYLGKYLHRIGKMQIRAVRFADIPDEEDGYREIARHYWSERH
ncbi:hypothetical protein J6590_092040, partial [Homalodisca vitripennis]